MNSHYMCENCHQGTASNTRPATRSEGCPVCPVGQYQDQKAQTSCKLCAKGYYQDKTGQSSCLACGAGTYQDKEEQTQCIACPDGQYQDQKAQTSCKTCPAGQVPNAAKTACVEICDETTYPSTTKPTVGGYYQCTTEAGVTRYRSKGKIVIKYAVSAGSSLSTSSLPFKNVFMDCGYEKNGVPVTSIGSKCTYTQAGTYTITIIGVVDTLNLQTYRVEELVELSMESITSLKLGENASSYVCDIESISQLPPNLKSLDIRYMPKLKTFPELPNSVDTLNVTCLCRSMTLGTKPSSLTSCAFNKSKMVNPWEGCTIYQQYSDGGCGSGTSTTPFSYACSLP